MNILVVGGRGYLGAAIVKSLSCRSESVSVASRGPPTPVFDGNQLRWEQIVWTNDKSLLRLCEDKDCIINAVAMNSAECANDPLGAFAFNGFATQRLVACSVRAGVTKFVNLSTAHVYTDKMQGVLTESTVPNNSHPYAASHLLREKLIVGATESTNVNVLNLRVSNVFGLSPADSSYSWSLVVNDLCRQAVTKGEIELYGDPLQQRDFIPMAEFCRKLIKCMRLEGLEKKTDTVNLGSGFSKTLAEMAHLVADRCEIVVGNRPCVVSKSYGLDKEEVRLQYKSNFLQEDFDIGLITTEIDNLLSFFLRQKKASS